MNCSDMGPTTWNSDKLARHHKMYRKSDKSHDLSNELLSFAGRYLYIRHNGVNGSVQDVTLRNYIWTLLYLPCGRDRVCVCVCVCVCGRSTVLSWRTFHAVGSAQTWCRTVQEQSHSRRSRPTNSLMTTLYDNSPLDNKINVFIDGAYRTQMIKTTVYLLC